MTDWREAGEAMTSACRRRNGAKGGIGIRYRRADTVTRPEKGNLPVCLRRSGVEALRDWLTAELNRQ